MRYFQALLLGSLLMSVFTGCSLQKRSLLPGYHFEWQKGTARASSYEFKEVQHTPIPSEANVECVAEASLSGEHSFASAVQPTYPKIIASLPRIEPNTIDHRLKRRQLVEPQPWDEAEKKQKRFGNIALGALTLQTLLQIIGGVGALTQILGLLVIVAFILNRRFREEVLSIKSSNGIDVTQERERFHKTNRSIAVGAGAFMLLGLIVLVLLFALISGGGFCFFC